MKKIMIIANNDVGLYKFRKELVETLLKDNKVFIVSPKGDFIEKFTSQGCIYYPTEFDRHSVNPIDEIRLLQRYKKIISCVEPDVVLTYTIKPNIYGGIVCAKRKIPYVANITGLGTAVENRGILQFITVSLYRYALRKAEKVFFQNEDNLIFMKNKNIVKKNYDLIPGSGVNLQEYRPLPYPNVNTVDFLFVARVMKEKGIEQYLEAAEYIRKKYPYTRFHVCGACEQEYQSRLKKMQEEDVVVYHGAVKDMVPMYQLSECTIHPTYYPEGMSNVLLESCASARSIITTNRAGCREIIENGKNGYICEQRNSADLIEKIEQFLSLSRDERKKMGESGRIKVESEFDRSIVVRKYVEEISKYG